MLTFLSRDDLTVQSDSEDRKKSKQLICYYSERHLFRKRPRQIHEIRQHIRRDQNFQKTAYRVGGPNDAKAVICFYYEAGISDMALLGFYGDGERISQTASRRNNVVPMNSGRGSDRVHVSGIFRLGRRGERTDFAEFSVAVGREFFGAKRP